MNLSEERANVTSMALPIATIPMRFRVDGSRVVSAAPEPNSLNADHMSRTVVHSPLGSSKDARYEENWWRQFTAFNLCSNVDQERLHRVNETPWILFFSGRKTQPCVLTGL